MGLLIIGASGLARESLPVARAAGLDPVGILDDMAATLAIWAGVPAVPLRHASEEPGS